MIPPLCFITDAAAPQSVADQALAAARGGAGWVQLRDKTLPDAAYAALARDLMARLAGTGAQLVVNDRAEVAIAIGAPALHIGQEDGDPAAIRRRIGPAMTLGLSVGNAAELAAVPAGVDYLGLGPVHATASKADHAPPIGLGGFARLAAATPLPCLAIGGITAAEAAAIRAAGGAGLAVVSAISRSPDMVAAAQDLLRAWEAA
ncbi:thiamine phosphate synthase [Falsirhodobacter algicola]|uniref:Thiamine-phosphate synthase n=1 Tax=Falsirhodobacter algicola TaxID=2692330 RepID=A0A8J8SM24_9RHOB|nr:thiamine phosphate synthase [Falsirhodobacter algicola]QUS37019.1 thiamine phosphate synthase [Falsirhodobacter algicola]